ncbi:DUF4267 domain-containing protein [Rhodococcus triatomae]|uniref:DUF4267 domain-containing protein n=1 Tax=Rhodococcus triatomae TaxID=300028 RepID=A0A1G8A8K9_9NOCA|nr:DUF4267 domain-containing protein [Rhodococcus triatomae]QNG17834.1 DUF4267 domain-containing protein [Rhodococcus triatomae]QNG22498.1 DUF4267 domain-containing protein [Rhodococcus triatomae]SDH17258.1 protein of unknown function [Rhodococcus triatomae]
MSAVATILTVIGAAFIIGIGLSYLIRPYPIAQGFGFRRLPGRDDPYYRVKGIRDLASGLGALALLLIAPPHVLGVFMLVSALVPLGDMLIVWGYRGRRAYAAAVHGLTAVAVVGTGILWLLV